MKLGLLVLGNAAITDTDGDGLVHAGETAVGTSPDLADSDGDSVNDLAELRAGTNPLGQQFAQNTIVGNVLIPLRFRSTSDVEVSGYNTSVAIHSTSNGRRFAYVATANLGFDLTTFSNVDVRDQIAVIDVTDASQPVVIGTIALPNDFELHVGQIAVDDLSRTLAIPSELSGLLLYDLSNPELPVLEFQQSTPVRMVRAFGGLLYAVVPDPVQHSTSSIDGALVHDSVVVIDPANGATLQSVRLVNRTIRDLDVDASGVYLASTSLRYVNRNNTIYPIRNPVIDQRRIDNNGRLTGAGSWDA